MCGDCIRAKVQLHPSADSFDRAATLYGIRLAVAAAAATGRGSTCGTAVNWLVHLLPSRCPREMARHASKWRARQNSWCIKPPRFHANKTIVERPMNASYDVRHSPLRSRGIICIFNKRNDYGRYLVIFSENKYWRDEWISLQYYDTTPVFVRQSYREHHLDRLMEHEGNCCYSTIERTIHLIIVFVLVCSLFIVLIGIFYNVRVVLSEIMTFTLRAYDSYRLQFKTYAFYCTEMFLIYSHESVESVVRSTHTSFYECVLDIMNSCK